MFPLEHDQCSCNFDEHGLATDMLACEKGSAPSSQPRTCCVPRRVSDCMAKRDATRMEQTFRWSVRRAPWLRVCDADHMQAVTRETHSSVTGTHRQLTCHRFCDGLSCRGMVGEGGGGGRLAWQVLEFLCRRGRQGAHTNTWRCDIAQLTLTFSSACETQLHCQLRRRVRAPHGHRDSSIHTLLLCISELAIWAVSCHIQ